jgi:hypothetical protein
VGLELVLDRCQVVADRRPGEFQLPGNRLGVPQRFDKQRSDLALARREGDEPGRNRAQQKGILIKRQRGQHITNPPFF